jgi:oligopeptide/dipeptide ABC transporter ATP-binding protein
MSASRPILELRGVSKAYRRPSAGIFSRPPSIRAVDDVSFSITRGEAFGLVGESGCGKSTLGRIVVDLIKDAEGECLLDGTSVRERKDLSRRVQIIFQDPLSALNPKKRVGWIMEEPLRIHGMGKRDERSRKVNRMLETVGLDGSYRERFPSELSGGQRQRICIGAALMLEPELLVADEIVSALDVSVQAQILNLLSELRERLGLTLLFISHNLDVVRYLCDRVAVMYRGRIVEIASVEAAYAAPLHPYTRLLLESLPGLEPRDRRASAPEKGEAVERAEAPEGCCFYHRCPIAAELCKTTAPELLPPAGVEGEERLVRCHFAL